MPSRPGSGVGLRHHRQLSLSSAELEGFDMVAEWITSLAATGGATLVAAAATDAWQQAKAGFARLFGRGDHDREAAVARRLDALAGEVEQAPPARRAELLQRLRDEWRV